MAHRTLHGRWPRLLLTEGTPAAGVTRPIIDSCDNLPHVGDWHRWRPVSKQVLPWRSQKLAAVYVKGFGCRALTGVRHTPAAGVRKPPMDETAMGSGWRCRGHYGDLAAAAEVVGCRRGDGW